MILIRCLHFFPRSFLPRLCKFLMGSIEQSNDFVDVSVKINKLFYLKYSSFLPLHEENVGKPKQMISSDYYDLNTLKQNINVDLSFSISKPKKYLLIKGRREDVNRSKAIILNAIDECKRNSDKFTHIIALPFLDEKFIENYHKFRDEVLRMQIDVERSTERVHKFLFQKSTKLHMTIVCLSLNDEDKIEKARELLLKESENFVRSKIIPKQLEIRGLGYFKEPRKEKANVLYARIGSSSDQIQVLADSISKTMILNGLAYRNNGEKYFEDNDSVKLHLTMMNTAFIRRNITPRERKSIDFKRIKYFDATKILDNFNDYSFGTLAMPPIQLCDVRKSNEFGYYQIVESFDLNAKM